MRSRTRMAVGVVLLAACLTCWGTTSSANWLPGGNRLTRDESDEGFPVMAADQDGGLIVAWQQWSRAYAQKLDPHGDVAVAWPADGVEVCPNPTRRTWEQCAPRIAPDGAGGAFVLWHDGRDSGCYYHCSDEKRELYINHLDATGHLSAGWPALGLRVGSYAGEMLFTNGTARIVPGVLNTVMIADGSGGAIVAWQEVPPLSGDSVATIRVQRLSADGRRLWGLRGAYACCAAGEHRYPVLASDGAGGAVVAWEEWGNGDDAPRVYGQHVGADGRASWGLSGRPLGAAPAGNADHQLLQDGREAARIVWSSPTGDASRVMTRRVRLHGWMNEQDEVLDAAACPRPQPQEAADAGGRVWFAWLAPADSGRQQIIVRGGTGCGMAHHTSLAGEIPGPKTLLRLSVDARGAAYVAWLENAWSPRAVGLTPAGRPQSAYPASGLHVDDPVRRTSQLELVAAGPDGARVCWERARYPSPDDVVLVQRLPDAGPGEHSGPSRSRAMPSATAGSLTVEGVTGRPVRVSFALRTSGRVGLELFDVAGRLLMTRDLGWLAAGGHDLPVVDGTQRRPGIYFVRLSLDGRPAGSRQILIR